MSGIYRSSLPLPSHSRVYGANENAWSIWNEQFGKTTDASYVSHAATDYSPKGVSPLPENFVFLHQTDQRNATVGTYPSLREVLGASSAARSFFLPNGQLVPGMYPGTSQKRTDRIKNQLPEEEHDNLHSVEGGVRTLQTIHEDVVYAHSCKLSRMIG